jgi:nucleoid DNA-binding protein
MSTLTKRKLAQKVAQEASLDLDESQGVVEVILESIVESLTKGENVHFRKFGVFNLIRRNRKLGRNPKKPEQSVMIPERTVVKFKPSKFLGEKVKSLKI